MAECCGVTRSLLRPVGHSFTEPEPAMRHGASSVAPTPASKLKWRRFHALWKRVPSYAQQESHELVFNHAAVQRMTPAHLPRLARRKILQRLGSDRLECQLGPSRESLRARQASAFYKTNRPLCTSGNSPVMSHAMMAPTLSPAHIDFRKSPQSSRSIQWPRRTRSKNSPHDGQKAVTSRCPLFNVRIETFELIRFRVLTA